MSASVYILYSERIDRFYTGFTTEDLEVRLTRNNSNYYDYKWAKRGIPWTIFFTLDCGSINQAKAIEAHIKKIKSKKYIHNLTMFSNISLRLFNLYKDC